MTAQDDPYVRLHYRLVEDEVFDDDLLLAWYTRMKIAADGMYPAPAALPRKVPDEIVARLVELGHIRLASGDRYHMRDVDEDRALRSEAAKRAAAARWGTGTKAPDARSDAGALRVHPTGNAPASGPRTASADGSQRVDADAMRVHDAAHPAENASPLRSAPSESSVAGPPARPGGGGPARLADVVPFPPGHPAARAGARRSPSDDEIMATARAKLADPGTPDWDRDLAREQLLGLGLPVPS